ncbi:MAG TPA: recombinase family protein [Patescibacteria group bacterium]|nr:recombinase family protein [Patescibacteria group bacterium]
MGCRFRAALYIRVSTEEQAAEGQSVTAQIEILTQYCKLYDIEIYDVYKDLGISGKETRNRPQLIRMLQDAKNGCFNLVLVWKISRLSRSLKDLLLILDQFEKLNIVFSSYSEKFDTSTAVGKMTLQLLGSIAEFERNTIIDNVKLGLQEYARKGGKTGTVLGYDNCNKQLFINANEAEMVKMIYRLYTEAHMSMSKIAEHMNALGCKTKRNNFFSKDSIAVILSNPVYIGINRHKVGQEEAYSIKGSHPPIIEVTTWNTAQALRESNKKKRPTKNKQLFFLLSGKIQCPSCSSLMYSFTTSAASKTYRYYRCKGCKSICNAAGIEEAVLNHLKKISQGENSILTPMVHLMQHNSIHTANKNLDLLKRESERIQKLLDKYVLLLDDEAFIQSEVILNKIKDLEIRLEELQNTRESLVESAANHSIYKNKAEHCAKTISQLFEENDRNIIRKLIDTYIKLITLTSSKTLKDIVFHTN